jgi:16S rRNA (cytosine1402-N4)-methyltransferase
MSSLNLRPGQDVLDATVGAGGHAEAILEKILPGGRLIGIDVDQDALKRTRERLLPFADSTSLIHGNFRDLDLLLNESPAKRFDAILMDLGISSYQIEDADRGFSIKHNARLDMRMDMRLRSSAYDIVNRLKEKELSDIIWEFGEERFSRKIAKRIVEAREAHPIETTFELSEVVRRAVGSRYLKSAIHPATRTFQAIRIAVNDELGAMKEGLLKALAALKIGGRIAVISFHSLEDRIAKNTFREYKGKGILSLVNKKPMIASNEETMHNPRSRSAKLRIAERIA